MYSYDFINRYNAKRNPSAIHCRDTGLYNYFCQYLFQKAISVYDFNLPEEWAENYFKYVLFGMGYIAVFDTEEFGVVCNECGLSGYNLYYQPNKAIVANPVLPNTLELDIGVNTEIIKLMPDYGSIMNIVSTYADMMALCLETAGINLLNSKTSYIFFADNKTAAESYKKMYDQIASGSPLAVVDKNLLNDDGSLNYDMFTQNVGGNYITDRILNDMTTLENMFNTEIGIPNANTMKRERLITDEVNANNVDVKSKVVLWLNTMRSDIEKVNAMFGTNISVRYRYEAENAPESVLDEEGGDEDE